MQPVRGPVRRDVRPVSPHRPDFLSADRLPDVLPILDVLSCEQDVTIAGDDTLLDWRSHTINLPPEIPEYRKGTNDDHRQAEPQSSIMHENPLRLEIGVGTISLTNQTPPVVHQFQLLTVSILRARIANRAHQTDGGGFSMWCHWVVYDPIIR